MWSFFVENSSCSIVEMGVEVENLRSWGKGRAVAK